MDPRELAIQSAISDLDASIFTSQRKAAKAYDVPQSTLQERINSRQSHTIAHQQQQRLTLEQERFIVRCILNRNSHAQPPSHLRV
jgi:hypothetical protein